MPVQHTLFGWTIPRISPRRVAQLLAAIAIFALITLLFTLPTSIPGPSLSKFTDSRRISIPKISTKFPSPSILNPFRPVAHAPPLQENSTNGEASWYSNWNWLSPFSSSVTLDESRSLLPPLQERPAIYTYYDHLLKKDEETKEVDNAILITWRKAWWAQGFKPVILGPSDAMNNPLFEEMQKLELPSAMQTELSRWLAWEYMGAGILCHYYALPMGSREDPLLSYLRRGDYPKLTRYEGLNNGLFSGPKTEVTAVIRVALANRALKTATDILQVMPADAFHIDAKHEGIAFYERAVISTKYGKVEEAIVESPPRGLKLLNQLMNAHLHNTWQNEFSSGIAVLRPLPEHTYAILEPAVKLAEFLSQCPESPLPTSCPPNIPKCKQCVSTMPLKVSLPLHYRNTSNLYTIGTVPHPYTLAILNALRETIDVPYIRRKTDRDTWITAVTRELWGDGISSAPRVVKFKEAVASPYGKARSLWFTAEIPMPTDLDWHFGFKIPTKPADTGKSETPVPGPEGRAPPAALNPPLPDENKLILERQLLKKAVLVGKSKNKEHVRLRMAIEAWNLADIEAWRFARAFLARSSVEQLKWEEDEKKYGVGTLSKKAGNGWGGWFERI
jgi:hypothetical protein